MAVRPTFLGIAAALFFQCMGVLLNPSNTIRSGVKWVLVVHTVALFSFMTISLGIGLNYLSIEYIDSREFPGNNVYPPGPLGNDFFINSEALTTVSEVLFPLNQWLADGLLVGLISNSIA